MTPRRRRPLPPWVSALLALCAGAGLVATVAGLFPFDPIGRQIVWLGSSFTLTAVCVAYVIQERRLTAWDEEAYQAALRRRLDGA